MAEERVQKILARAGYASRRASEELITGGRVKINGKTAILGSRADPERDTITVDNQPIAREQAPVYIALNKPTGILSEVSPDEPRETVRDLVPVPGHLFIVGRLDLESEGLILMTNDGDLANKLTHPRYGHEKEYRVLVGARPDSRQIDAWHHGVVLEDGYRTAPAQMRIEGVAGRGAWLRVVLREGRKRQIREMGKQTGLPVLRIQRIRIGSLLLGELKPGEWRHLRPEEVRALKVNKPYREEAPGLRRRTYRAGSPGRASTSERPAGERPARRSRPEDRPGRSGGRERTVEKPPRPVRERRQRSEDRPEGTSTGGPGAERRPRRSGERPAGTGTRPERPVRAERSEDRPGGTRRTRKP